MSTDLFLTTYHQRERELQQRLEHARVARERAAAPVDRGPGRAARDARAHQGTVRVLAAWFARGRDAARGASGATPCCSPA